MSFEKLDEFCGSDGDGDKFWVSYNKMQLDHSIQIISHAVKRLPIKIGKNCYQRRIVLFVL